jgi:aldehyde dehydrogenase (NAD+)
VEQPQLQTAPGGFDTPALDRTAKLFVGGKQARPDGNYSRVIVSTAGKLVGEVGEGNRKDIRNAVAAARGAEGLVARHHAQPGADPLLHRREPLRARRRVRGPHRRHDRRLRRQGEGRGRGAINRLFSYGAWADKYEGVVHSPPLRGVALAMNEPIGVAGVVCPDEAPLLSFISLVAPLITVGNRVVVVPSERHPLCATDFYQVLETSDVPAGVINIVTGAREDLTKTLADHDDVDALWVFGTKTASATARKHSVGNLKRTLVDHGLETDWYDPVRLRANPVAPRGAGKEYLDSVRRIAKIGGTRHQGRRALLKNLDPLLNADVLHALRAMGHGDYLVLSDTNFPSDSVARQTVLGKLLRIDANCPRRRAPSSR